MGKYIGHGGRRIAQRNSHSVLFGRERENDTPFVVGPRTCRCTAYSEVFLLYLHPLAHRHSSVIIYCSLHPIGPISREVVGAATGELQFALTTALATSPIYSSFFGSGQTLFVRSASTVIWSGSMTMRDTFRLSLAYSM